MFLLLSFREESDIPLTSTNDISVIIQAKNFLKFDTIESKNLKSQLKDIAKKLNDYCG